MEAKILDWQYATIHQNQVNVANWRRKMRCVEAVESVGEYGGYADLRTALQRALWLKIRIQVKAIRELFLLEKDRDIYDDLYRP